MKVDRWVHIYSTKDALVSEEVDGVPAPQWIPCSERLPEEKGEYMVTVKYFGWNGKADIALLSSRYTKTKGWHLTEGKVIAWMPLPEPYKEGQE